MRTLNTRILSLLLSLIVLMTAMPINLLAEDSGEQNQTIEITENDATEDVTNEPEEEAVSTGAVEEDVDNGESAGTTAEDGVSTSAAPIPDELDSATVAETDTPTVQEDPTETPAAEVTESPTETATENPTEVPTEEPTAEPTAEVTETPTEEITAEPTETATAEPTEAPTEEPTEEPTSEPQSLTLESDFGISVTIGEEALPEGIWLEDVSLSVKELGSADLDQILWDYPEIKTRDYYLGYEISLKDLDGNTFEPVASVSLSMTIPEIFEDGAYIYHVTDGTATQILAVPGPGVSIFSVDSFSAFILTDTSSTASVSGISLTATNFTSNSFSVSKLTHLTDNAGYPSSVSGTYTGYSGESTTMYYNATTSAKTDSGSYTNYVYYTPHYLKIDGKTVYAFCIQNLKEDPNYSSYTYKSGDTYNSLVKGFAFIAKYSHPYYVYKGDMDKTRGAAQEAIRCLIYSRLGVGYVKSIHNISQLSTNSRTASEDFLTYLKWLYNGALSELNATGNLTYTVISEEKSGSNYVWTLKLSTDASEGWEIKDANGSSVSVLTGNNGDTVTVTSPISNGKASFTLDFWTYNAASYVQLVEWKPANSKKQILLYAAAKTPTAFNKATLSETVQVASGAIKITKTDSETGKTLTGAAFTLLDASGNKIAGPTSVDANGVVTFTGLTAGNYTVVETTTPTNYHVTVTDGKTTAVVQDDVTTELTITNAPDKGYLKILKTAKDNGEKIVGAVFEVREKTSGTLVDTITTGDNGIATSKALPVGTYLVKETRSPTIYELNTTSYEATITKHGVTVTVEIQDEVKPGYIKIIKRDSLDQTPIAGVVFEILDSNGKVYDTITTDKNGTAISKGLPRGTYSAREKENPTGYVYDIWSQSNIKIEPTKTVTYTVTNQPIQGKIKIIKTDKLTGEALAGAEFTITRVKALPSHGNTGVGVVVATIVTDKDGIAESPLLTYGTYLVTETKVPEHFVDNSFSVEVNIEKDNMKTYEIEAENEPTKGWIQITKTDSLDGAPIEGVQFDIFYNDEYGSGLAGTMTTNAKGVATSPALRKGKYIVKEHADPTGYVTELIQLDATVKSDETTKLTAENKPIQGKVRIIKTDELTGEALAGAEFTITRISGLPSHNGSGNGDVVAVITTNAEGIAESPLLTYGTYKVEETVVPKHFVDNSFSVEVTIDKEDLQTYEIEAENEPTKGWIQISKTDRENGNPIEGVQFDIYYNDEYGEGFCTSMVTDEHGIAISEPIRKGTYIVKEHGATAGYFFEEVTLDATVKSDEITELEATNQPVLIQLKIYKRDEEEYGGDINNTSTRGDGKLTGAEFQVLAGDVITDRQGNVLFETGEVVVDSLKTSGDDASVTSEELWPGIYEIVEINPPTGYQASDTHFIIDASAAAEQSKEAVITYEGLKTNTILYGAISLVKFLGDNQIHAEAGIEETPEEGAIFEVYLKKAGSYEDAREFERDLLTTDAYGRAQTKALPYGVYVLHQTYAVPGFALMHDIEFQITGTEDLDNPPLMILNNQAIRYRLKIIKTDEETGNTITLANTAFKLRDSEGNIVTQTVNYPSVKTLDTFYTDESGTVTLPETVTWGQYTIEEIVSPEGYLIRTEELPVFVGTVGDTPEEVYEIEVEVPNTPVKGNIILEKTGLILTGFNAETDEYGNEVKTPVYEDGYLEDAVFEIYAAERIIGQDGTLWYEKDELVETLVTGNGPSVSSDLPLGKYYLIETEAPYGYVFEDTRYEAELSFKDNQTAVVEISVTAGNDFIPAEISLEKEKEIIETKADESGNVAREVVVVPGDGFVFGLYNSKDIQTTAGTLLADTLVATGATDENGELTFSGNFPHGDYYIKELSAPEGWKISSDTYSVSVVPENKDEDNVIRIALEEPILNELIYTEITLTKKEITGDETLPNTRLELLDENGEIITCGYTDENGEIPDIPVVPGTYTFREILAPEGYELNVDEVTFTVDEYGNVTGDTTVRDDFTRVYLLKVDENGNPLPGVTFTLSKEDGTALMTAVSDSDGVVTFEKVPYGTFIISETKTVSGYVRSKETVTLSVDGTFVNPKEALAEIENIPNEVVLQKLDQDEMPLPGAAFTLFTEEGERIITAISDENGLVRFTKIPVGTYTIHETAAPDGYLRSCQIIQLTIDEDYENSVELLATIINPLKRIKYIKVDTSGEYLPNVEFSLLKADTEEVMEVVTSNSIGEFIFTQFDYGDWIIRETKVPEGFNKMEDITFHVDEGWTEPKPFTCVNIPNHYEFVKTDNEGVPLSGVRFSLEDSEGNLIRDDFYSDEDGIVHVTDLTPGTYVIREIETLEGYTLSGETIQVVIDENYIVPEEMFTLVNYPEIKTGAGIEMTAVSWFGVAITASGLLLLIFWFLKKKKEAAASDEQI